MRFRASVADGGPSASRIGACSRRAPSAPPAAFGPVDGLRDRASLLATRPSSNGSDRRPSASTRPTRRQLFEGRPHHLLQGVIVVDVTVDRSGKVMRSKIVRSPGIARLDNVVLASLKTASPLPAPPPAIVKTGAITYSETWLFTNDSKWRLRTLTLPQE